jgi:hypothetical protein
VRVPEVGWETAEIMRIVLVFPAPLGPRKPNVSPRLMVKLTPLTASKSPKRLTSSCASRIGSLIMAYFIGSREREE